MSQEFFDKIDFPWADHGKLPEQVISKLKKQLAAERERNNLIGNERNELLELRDRLYEQRIMLVDALKEAREVIAEEYGTTVAAQSPLIKRIDAALEKVEEES